MNKGWKRGLGCKDERVRTLSKSTQPGCINHMLSLTTNKLSKAARVLWVAVFWRGGGYQRFQKGPFHIKPENGGGRDGNAYGGSSYQPGLRKCIRHPHHSRPNSKQPTAQKPSPSRLPSNTFAGLLGPKRLRQEDPPRELDCAHQGPPAQVVQRKAVCAQPHQHRYAISMLVHRRQHQWCQTAV